MTKKLTIEVMHDLAKAKGGECLSIEYINIQTKLKWECKKGHIWEAIPINIKQRDYWCSECAGNKKLTIEEMQDLAKAKGGKCLSTEYINNQTKLKWECKKGHIWEAIPSHIKQRKQWCPKCAGIKKLTIEEMNQIALSKGGKCLSTKYINSSTKLKWECKDGHVWKAIPSSINKGHWCRKCASIANHKKL